MELRLVLVTTPNSAKSKEMAKALVERRLAACVNIIPGLTSVYEWEGKLHEDQEELLLIKTSAASLSELEKAVHQLHSYSTPEFVVVEPGAVSARYLEWALNVLSAQPPKGAATRS